MLGRTTIGDLSYVEEEWAEKVRVRVGEGGKWTVLRHCRDVRGLSSDKSGRGWEECLRMGRGSARLIGDIGGERVDVSKGKRTWGIKVVGEVGDRIKERLFGCCGPTPPPRRADTAWPNTARKGDR